MRYLTSSLIIVTTALWFGGLVTLALLVTAVFKTPGLDRETAGRAASSMFVYFGKAQLIVAAVALIATFFGYLQRRGGIIVTLFVLQIVAAIAAVAFNMYFVPRLDNLRSAGQSQSADFQAMHKQSVNLMSGAMFILLAGTILIPAVCRALFAPRKSSAAD
jgi:glucan phosphoethanolaminetransferase (alkaline phosphatase superfamily)